MTGVQTCALPISLFLSQKSNFSFPIVYAPTARTTRRRQFSDAKQQRPDNESVHKRLLELPKRLLPIAAAALRAARWQALPAKHVHIVSLHVHSHHARKYAKVRENSDTGVIIIDFTARPPLSIAHIVSDFAA
mgnify:CR=1 FL=1